MVTVSMVTVSMATVSMVTVPTKTPSNHPQCTPVSQGWEDKQTLS